MLHLKYVSVDFLTFYNAQHIKSGLHYYLRASFFISLISQFRDTQIHRHWSYKNLLFITSHFTKHLISCLDTTWILTTVTVYRVVFALCYFHLLHLQTVSPHLEFAQIKLCFKRDIGIHPVLNLPPGNMGERGENISLYTVYLTEVLNQQGYISIKWVTTKIDEFLFKMFSNSDSFR